MSEFRMPSLGADMEAGKLVEWLKHPGDKISRGDIIAVVETQKGAIEVEVFENGRLEKLLVEEGTTVPVGTPLAIIVGAGEAIAATPSAPSPPPVPSPTPPAPAVPQAPAPPSPASEQRMRASPAARKLAAERGVDLAGVKGTGPDGAIVSTDIGRADIPAAPARYPAGIDLAEMRKAIPAAMARSKREIPHYYLGHDIDFGPATEFVQRLNVDRAPDRRLLPGVLLIKATARALVEHPRFNGFYVDGQFRPGGGVHIGTAIAIRGGGLVAPAIHDADKKSLDELMDALRDVTARVRAGRIRSSEMTDPTMTISSLGERGVDTLYGVIYPPQVSLIGFGTPHNRPWCVGGGVAVRRIVSATLAADHRVTDGHQGALLLASIARHLQEPEKL